MKDLVILGGPNGAGKTTAAKVLLPDELGLVEFVNADNIAAGLSPFNPAGVAVAAGRLMLTRIEQLVHAGTSLAIETTCAGTGYRRLIRRCQAEGWRVTLIFVWLDDPDIAVRRVAQRVSEGGHTIPTDVIHRRFWAGLRNARHLYLDMVDAVSLVDNSGGEGVAFAQRRQGSALTIRDMSRWRRFEEMAS